MEYEFIIVTLISSLCGLFGLVFLSYRKDRRSDISFDRKLTYMDKQSSIKMKEARTRTTLKLKQPKEKTGLPIDTGTIKDLISAYTGGNKEDETEEDKSLLEQALQKILEKIPDETIERLVNKYLGGKEEVEEKQNFYGQ